MHSQPAQSPETSPLDANAAAARPAVGCCPVCQSRRLHYAFSIPGAAESSDSYRVVRCDDCRLMLLNPQPSDAELETIYGERYFIGRRGDEPGGPDPRRVAVLKAATARQYLQLLARYQGTAGGRLLDVGCGHGDLLVEAQRAGFAVTGVEIAPAAAEVARARLKYEPHDGPPGQVIRGSLESAGLPAGQFDVAVLADVIEHARDPVALLREVRRVLKPGGALLIATPSLESWSARLLKRNWMEFKPEHLTYFDPNTLQTALFQAGFHDVIVRPGWKVLSLDYVAGHFQNYTTPVVSRLVRTAARLAPRRLRERDVTVVASGMLAVAKAAPPAAEGSLERRTLSVIVPAYNEAATVGPLLDAVLRKEVPGMDIEVIVVESNSTDGTRDVVRRFEHHPRVKLILEDRPRGKGRAVRTGLEYATGDFVLIQDADLEYDLEDYDVLLEPLAGGREALVLGSRHGGNAWWKMRQFTGQRLLSLFFNCGHWVFTTLLNVLFGQRLKDPFTMYKVFRRDCLYGLEFRCNRFDFDHELLVKLIRKGYRPVEIPVNYRSRSFKEGKKVSAIRDPLTWLRALVRLRFERVDPLAVVSRNCVTGVTASSAAGGRQVAPAKAA